MTLTERSRGDRRRVAARTFGGGRFLKGGRASGETRVFRRRRRRGFFALCALAALVAALALAGLGASASEHRPRGLPREDPGGRVEAIFMVERGSVGGRRRGRTRRRVGGASVGMAGPRKRVSLKPHVGRIREWTEAGKADDWIADALGTSASSVQAFRSRNGIRRLPAGAARGGDPRASSRASSTTASARGGGCGSTRRSPRPRSGGSTGPRCGPWS